MQPPGAGGIAYRLTWAWQPNEVDPRECPRQSLITPIAVGGILCGIAGLILPRRAPFSRAEAESIVASMTAAVAHRGPDAKGLWHDPEHRCVLGHRRLSVIDTSDAGLQPFASGDGRWRLTFNGEIYNFQELRPRLEKGGISIRSRTDSEILVEALALWGVEAVKTLDGMFAFAAFDSFAGETILARDPFGEKPLYYMQLPERGIAFASELQALERVPGFNGAVDVDAMAEVLCFQYIGAPRTIYGSVQKLAPGHWMKVTSDGEIRIERYFAFEPGRDLFEGRSQADLVDEAEDILLRSLRRRLISDVPLGAFLSGGVDSSTACALVRRKLGQPLVTFSVGFQGFAESEHETAQAFANHLGTEHHSVLLEPQGEEFLRGIGQVMDEPNGDSSCLPTYLLSRFARERVTVAISGDGGDEMFGGYGRYVETLDEAAGKAQQAEDWFAGNAYYSHRLLVANELQIADLFGFVPSSFSEQLGNLRADVSVARPNLLAAMRRHDVDRYLPGAVLAKVDRMSMQHSLEVRTPYLNVDLARFAEKLPSDVLVKNGKAKILLRELAYRYLPRHLVDLPKRGFGLPMSSWTSEGLQTIASSLLESEDGRLAQVFGWNRMKRFMDHRRRSGGGSVYQLWAMVTLESWLRSHPVNLPDLRHERKNISPAGLSAAAIAEGVYVIQRSNGRMSDAERALPALMERLVDLVTSARTSRVEDLELQDWSVRLSDADVQRLAPLRGATLVFPEPGEARLMDHRCFAWLFQLGIERVIFASPKSAGRIAEFTLNSRAGITLAGSIARLWPNRLASFSVRRLSRALLGSQKLVHRDGHRFEADWPHLPAQTESAAMVFEGFRQLPPFSVPPFSASVDDISERGCGRHAIVGNKLHLSPTDQSAFSKTFWAVPLTKRTRRHLQITPMDSHAEVNGAEDANAELASYFRADDGVGFELQPGDPIVVCTDGLPAGGAERQWIYLARALDRAGYRVTFLTATRLQGHNSHYLPLLHRFGIELFDAWDQTNLDILRNLPHLPHLNRLIAATGTENADNLIRLMAAFTRLQPKAVFAQLDDSNLLCALAARFCRGPRVVMSFRNYNPSYFWFHRDWYRPCYQLVARSGAVRFSGNGRDANADYADWIGLSRSRVHHVPNVIDPEDFVQPSSQIVAELRNSLRLEPDAQVLLGAFRLHPEKDPVTFLEVCFRLTSLVPALRVLVAGDGSMRSDLEERVARHGLQNRIMFLGDRQDVNVLMTLSDVVLHTPVREGMSNVAAEAQLMARPMVASAIPGIAEVVRDRETALLCPAGDVEALAAACMRLLTDRPMALAMGAAGRQHVLREFAKDDLANRYLSVLHSDA